MPRPLFDSAHIFGIHEPGRSPSGEQIMRDAGKPGWIVFTEELGHDPNQQGGRDYRPYSDQGLGLIACLNHGYEPNGTIPHSSLYAQFARRCANFVANSPGCKIWIIGNEMNYAVERPGVQIARSAPTRGQDDQAPKPPHPSAAGWSHPEHFSALLPLNRSARRNIVNPGEVITPQLYVRCYRLCREAIHQLPGHGDDQVLIGPVAPWNVDTVYADNPNGDWIKYFQDILLALGPGQCDGIGLHTYTHGVDPNLISDTSTMAIPFQNRHYNFLAYQDFMQAIPQTMRNLPVYITETCQVTPWANTNSGWVKRAYGEINHWNQQAGHQQIRALALYRWPAIDQWVIEGKQGVIDDFREALLQDYRWQEGSSQPPPALPQYGVEWTQVQAPSFPSAGSTITLSVTLRNTGSMVWPSGGGTPVRMGYAVFRTGQPVSSGQPTQTSLPRDVRPNESVTVNLAVVTPTQAGTYELLLDLFHQPVGWFRERGAQSHTRELRVQAATGGGADPALGPLDPALAPDRLVIQDVVDQLPRGTEPYPTRDTSQIQYLVINHTAVPASVSVEVIARVHVERGYPGIAYNFVVGERGEVFEVTRLENAVRPAQPWSGQGVNICLSGDFTDAPPSPAQLQATASLCARMAHNLGLTEEAILGVGEMLSYESPGKTFYEGPRWKGSLRTLTRHYLSTLNSGGETPPGGQDDSPAIQELQQRIATLTGQVQGLQRRVQELEVENQSLQDQLQGGGGSGATPPSGASGKVVRPAIDDVTLLLPRDAAGLFQRRVEDVQFVVINHTAVSPEVPLERIAEAHRVRLPGIPYQFYIDGDGNVFQTQPALTVVDNRQPFFLNGINIGFAGNFTTTIPTPAQLRGGGQLIAWLLEQFPQLEPTSIKGVREFIPTSSPGDQWMEGQNWKARLLEAVNSAERSAPPTGGGDGGAEAATLRAEIARLRTELIAKDGEIEQLRQALAAVNSDSAVAALQAQLTTLQGRLQSLQTEHQSLQTQYNQLQSRFQSLQSDHQALQGQYGQLQSMNQGLEVEVARLQAALAASQAGNQTGGGAETARVSRPPMRNRVAELPRHPTLRYDSRPRSQISHIAVHHTAIRPDVGPERIAELHIEADPSRGKEAWPGIGYHFFIHADGTIDQCNELETVSYNVYRNNNYVVGVVFGGSFMNGVLPTQAQIGAGAQLIAWLMQELSVPLENLKGHREFPDNVTACPGSEWTGGKRWRDMLLTQIHQVQTGHPTKSLEHFLLFWQRDYPGPFAESDLENAKAYIRRFRPTLGFDVEDALNAEYVTIVGGDAGVSGHDEERLRESGGNVERIAGVDEADTARQLMQKVQSGQRHRDMDH